MEDFPEELHSSLLIIFWDKNKKKNVLYAFLHEVYFLGDRNSSGIPIP